MNLTDVNFTGAGLKFANLRNADLEYSTFSHAYVDYAEFGCANISHADFTGVNGLGKSQLDSACGDDETKLPKGFPLNFKKGQACRDACPFSR
jgi:uncharacterized protein YjbI with pentapeptide repeats